FRAKRRPLPVARSVPRLHDDELMSHTPRWRRPFSWSSIAAFVVEALAACGFVIAVYELVVAGGIALFPGVSESGILVLWIAATSIAGSGMAVVRSRTRTLIRKVLPASDPYPALMSSVSGVAAAGPPEGALPRLAELLAEGTGARGAAVWLAGPSGVLRRARSWPGGGGPGPPGNGPGGGLRDPAGGDHGAPGREARGRVGGRNLRARAA